MTAGVKKLFSGFMQMIVIGLYLIAGGMLLYLFYRSVRFPYDFSEYYSGLLTFIFTVAYLILFILLAVFVRRISERILAVTGWIMIAATVCFQIYIAVEIQLLPDVDLSYVIQQSKDMLGNGKHYFTNREYFSVNANNIPLAILIYWVFFIGRAMGVTNYELIGGLFNVLMNFLTYVFGYFLARRLTDKRTSFLFLVFLLTNPSLYAYASYYYTDTISLAFTTIGVYCFVSGIQEEKKGIRWFWYISSGFFLFVAFRIRVTSVFIVIAAAVYWLLCRRERTDFRDKVLPFVIGTLVALLCYTGIYHYHIDFNTKDTATTWQYFVAMGANRETGGGYCQSDFDDTVRLPDHQSKVEYNTEKWKSRVRELGFRGAVTLARDKECMVWTAGCKHYFQYLEHVKTKNPIYYYIEGNKSAWFRNYMQAYNNLLLIAAALSILLSIKQREERPFQNILVIYWLGGALFYAFWEAHARYSVSFLLLMSLLLIPLLEKIVNIQGKLTRRPRD